MKACASCKATKPLGDFGKHRKTRDGLNCYCRECARGRGRAAMAIYLAKNQAAVTLKMAEKRADPAFRMREQARNRDLYQQNLDAQRKRKREWRRENPETRRLYEAENPDIRAAIKAKYRAACLNAMPSWADRQAIRLVYAEARRKNAETGIKHHVDHIVPLQGENVRGLHVPWNLQVLSAFDNRSKGNRLVAGLVETYHGHN